MLIARGTTKTGQTVLAIGLSEANRSHLIERPLHIQVSGATLQPLTIRIFAGQDEAALQRALDLLVAEPR